jgi:hypothetical protein
MDPQPIRRSTCTITTTTTIASVFFFGVITFVTVCTEVVTTQERSHAGNHIVVVVVIVQVDLLIGCGSMVNDSVEIAFIRVELERDVITWTRRGS